MEKSKRLKPKPQPNIYSYQRCRSAFSRAVNMIGGLGIMGKLLDLPRQTIWYRINKAKSFQLTIKECKLIEKATIGEITTKMLRSDF